MNLTTINRNLELDKNHDRLAEDTPASVWYIGGINSALTVLKAPGSTQEERKDANAFLDNCRKSGLDSLRYLADGR